MKASSLFLLFVLIAGFACGSDLFADDAVSRHDDEADHTMQLMDTMRNSFKVHLLSQRALTAYILALRDSDQDQAQAALDFLYASQGFIESRFIDNRALHDEVAPLIQENIDLINRNMLRISDSEFESLQRNFDRIRINGQAIEQDIWTHFQQDYIAFHDSERRLKFLFQGISVVAVLVAIVIVLLFLRQQRLLSEIVRQKQQLDASEERFSLAMRGANDGLWDWNLETDEVYYSPRWSEMLGYSQQELEPRLETWAKLVAPEDKERVLQEVKSYVQGDADGFETEFQMLRKDGSWASILSRGFLVRNASQALRLVGTHVDITERKRAEREVRNLNKTLEEKVIQRTGELARARDQAEAANQTKSVFLANMSHEIRTPMNAIIGMTQLALDTDLDKRQRNYVAKAHLSAENLLRILNDILDFSKIEAGRLEMEEVDFLLKDMVDNFVNLLRFKAEEKGIQLAVRIESDVPRAFYGDPLRLGQVLINLGDNAIKFSQTGDRVSMKVALDEDLGASARLRFSVEDSGVGMSLEQREKLFQPFVQADSSTTRLYGGTGLGLIISQKIVQLMGGDIQVRSELGVGSLFTFTVELSRQSAGRPDKALDAGEADLDRLVQQLRGARILLVEDNDINMELVQELLANYDMSVQTALDGREALEKLAEQPFDAVLMDCQMPVMDGYEATRHIRRQEQLRGLPVIAMTANAMKGDKEKVMAAGMNDHIAKPIKPQVMLATMAKWIHPGK